MTEEKKEAKAKIPNVEYCPFCGSIDVVYIGMTKDVLHVFRCNVCELYFALWEMEPPFEVTIK